LRTSVQIVYQFLSRYYDNFEDQNKVLEYSKIIVNYSIIINAYYD